MDAENVVIRFGKRKLIRLREAYYAVTIPSEIARTLSEQGVTAFEMVWVNGSLVLYPVKEEEKEK